MAVEDNAGPYAPPSAVLEMVRRHRSRGLPPVVDAAVLARCGISQSLIPRTLQAMIRLDLIDREGRPTDAFEAIRLAAEADLRPTLADWLNIAYADVLAFVDPATATDSQLRDAFRHIKPIGQQPRMVTLFTGLYAAAGIAPERGRRSSPSEKSAPRASAAAPKQSRQRPERRPDTGSGLPAPIGGLLTQLPRDGSGWTQQQRDRFATAFGAILDLCYPILSDPDNGRTNRAGMPRSEPAD